MFSKDLDLAQTPRGTPSMQTTGVAGNESHCRTQIERRTKWRVVACAPSTGRVVENHVRQLTTTA